MLATIHENSAEGRYDASQVSFLVGCPTQKGHPVEGEIRAGIDAVVHI